jgi:hypothetical protein
MLHYFQTSLIATIFVLSALTFIMYDPFPSVNGTTGTSQDIPTGVNDPTLPQSSIPDVSNTTSADIPTGVNDPTLPQSSIPDVSNTTSADIPTGVNDPTLPQN